MRFIASVALVTVFSFCTSARGRERGVVSSSHSVETAASLQPPRRLKKTKKSKKSKSDKVKETKKETKQHKTARPKRDKTVKKREPKHHTSSGANALDSDKHRPRGTDSSICEIVDLNDGVIAALSQDMCNEWIPGSGRSALCSQQETRNGGAVCSLAAQCILQELQDLDIGIVIISSGIAQADLQKGLLPYNQFRTVFPVNDDVFGIEMNGSHLVAALEDGLEAANNGDTEAFPCGVGIRYSVNMNAAKGSRLSNMQVRSDTEWVSINLNETYFVATTKTLLQGNHGYKSLSSMEDVIDLRISFYDLFASCAEANCPFTAIPASEYSTQQYT